MFLSKNNQIYCLPILSALLFSIAVYFEFFFIGLIALLPLFYSILNNRINLKSLLRIAISFHLILGIIIFNWSLDSIAAYTNGNTLISICIYAIFIFLFIAIGSIGISLFYLIQKQLNKLLYSGIILSILVTIYDIISSYAFEGLPWLHISPSYSIIYNNYVIQLASIGSTYIVTFSYSIITSLVVTTILNKKKISIIVTTLLLATIFLFSQQRINTFNKIDNKESLQVSLINENFNAVEKWDASSVNKLVNTYFELLLTQPVKEDKLYLWTESSVPWTYQNDDPFLDSLSKLSKNWQHIIGISTAINKENLVYNSAYHVSAHSVLNRYDKQYLLAMVERPLFALNLPFLATDGFSAKAGRTTKIFDIKNTKIGVLICNESNVRQAAFTSKRAGAEILYTMSNDSWFSQSKLLIKMHFLNARIRAAETGLPMIVNANLGYCGSINAIGIIETKYLLNYPAIKNITIPKKNIPTIITNY